jgi:hypothetical protein
MRLRSARAALLGLFVITASPAIASAQQVAEGPPKTQDIHAVERGFFIETDVGATLLVNKLEGRSYGLGLTAGLFLGYDVLPFLQILFGGVAIAASGAEDNAPRGDLLFLTPMVQIQFAFIATERDFLYVRAGGGFAFGLPEDIDGTSFGGSGPAFSGVVGYEHFTKVRHFSVGVTAGVIGVTKPGFGLGAAILPTLKYTF